MSNLFCNIDLTDSCEQEVLSIRQPEGKRSDFAAVNNTTAGQPCSDEDPSESNQCCICSERWDSSGSRRVVALKRCGHLFCLECISEWLRVQKPTSCPVCRQRYDLSESMQRMIRPVTLIIFQSYIGKQLRVYSHGNARSCFLASLYLCLILIF
jgi:hypothetical protein